MISPCSECIVFPMCDEFCDEAIQFKNTAGRVNDKCIYEIARRQAEKQERRELDAAFDCLGEVIRDVIDHEIMKSFVGEVSDNDKK